eukprot:4027219-Pleurochrysis_carterae.AAC.2
MSKLSMIALFPGTIELFLEAGTIAPLAKVNNLVSAASSSTYCILSEGIVAQPDSHGTVWRALRSPKSQPQF